MLETGSNQQHNVYCITQQTCQHDIEQIYAMGIPVFGTVRATIAWRIGNRRENSSKSFSLWLLTYPDYSTIPCQTGVHN